LILVDSSVWIDYFQGTITAQTERLDSLLGRGPLAIGDLIPPTWLVVALRNLGVTVRKMRPPWGENPRGG
jgi:hypothetical protein